MQNGTNRTFANEGEAVLSIPMHFQYKYNIKYINRIYKSIK